MAQTRKLRVGVTLVALILAALHVWRPDLQIDSVTVVLLVVALLPWVQPLIKSIELLGVKLELQEIKNELANAKGAAESAERKTEYLLSGTGFAPPVAIDTKATESTPSEVLAELTEQYDHVRATQPSGTARTQAMTGIVRKMIELAPSLQSFNVRDALMSPQRGRRLAAYAYLYARPDPQSLGPLVASVTEREDKPFGQYWGLQAISRVLSSSDVGPVSGNVRLQLSRYAERVPRGTDRDYEIRKILRDVGTDAVND